ncbi:o-methyltransferas-like protein [Coniochaeta sp. 2T2.1]|nr:o-methyltransferas-like protein [Coniochaeta sp. 2T2.1]
MDALQDPQARQAFIRKLRDLADSLETPENTLDRIAFGSLTTAVVRTGIELGLFHFLSKNDGPATLEEVATATLANPILLGRLLRHLSANGVVSQVGINSFQSNHVTKNLCVPGVEAGVNWFFEGLGPQYMELPAFLKRTNYANPTDVMHTVVQDAYKLDEGDNAFDWLQKDPTTLAIFQNFMSIRRQGAQETWLSVYPVEEETKSWNPDKAVYVNIGGNVGMQNAEFKQKYPSVPGRVILQDRPENVAKAFQTPGVENIAYDFFTPQPIKGAKFYYFRTVLHNWPDDKVVEILKNTKSAMEEESIILVDEIVVPDVGASSWTTSIDLTMLCGHASTARTQSQWDEVFAQAGLKRLSTMEYHGHTGESLMKLQAL